MLSKRDDLKFLLSLNKIPGIGSRRFLSIIEYFENGENFWHSSAKELMRVPGIDKRLCEAIFSYRSFINPDRELEIIIKKGINVITIYDSEYPYLLKNIYDPPPLLYFLGKLSDNDRGTIAVVGSRKATSYGKYTAEKISRELAGEGITIISGMAVGIDTFAHKGALSGGGSTIAVLGSGVDVIYPKRNAGLMQEIIKNGAVISEFPPGTQPVQSNFPARNRVISGLALGTVVVEAGERSGALITADFALEQGREVFAVPGNINSIYSKGTNKLIKQGAKLVDSVYDILDELGISSRKSQIPAKGCTGEGELSLEEQDILKNISGQGTTVDYIINITGFTAQKVNLILTKLELKGKIKHVPGNTFIRI
ncbi:DNA processing protein DprA [Koleobacter methoxysyntrophicus]|jgi:DNA processing protein|uniref:DNA processing protein DprA n=1 Tax=Koleobacter methoxysyntrophicus TaxID=2751313 RepID=A0A8A0RQR4_9FIRM|nr:processing protein [Thermosediminibacterales bacterium]MDK2901258.1 processing protein [Thermosediminibacterales bacterium]QSQ09869.1 DNA processing protein DprA [Koleobacter methoxysyntrophicus]